MFNFDTIKYSINTKKCNYVHNPAYYPSPKQKNLRQYRVYAHDTVANNDMAAMLVDQTILWELTSFLM